MPLGKVPFFAYVISRKRRATQRKKLQSNVSQVKRSLRAKIRLFLSTFKNSQKIKGTFLHAVFQLWNHVNLHTPMLFLHIHCVLLRAIDLLIYYTVLPTPQALRSKLNNLEISFNTGRKAEMIDVYKKSTCGLDFLRWRLYMNENHCKDFFTVLTFNLVKFFFFFDLIITLYNTENHMIMFLMEICHCELHAVTTTPCLVLVMLIYSCKNVSLWYWFTNNLCDIEITKRWISWFTDLV